MSYLSRLIRLSTRNDSLHRPNNDGDRPESNSETLSKQSLTVHPGDRFTELCQSRIPVFKNFSVYAENNSGHMKSTTKQPVGPSQLAVGK